MTFDQANECRGASGRKFRQVYFWCPNYERWRKRTKKEERKDEKGN